MYKTYTNPGINVYPPSSNNKNVNVSANKVNYCIDIGLNDNNSGDKFFKFTQAVASDEWVIVHNLDKYPSVTVVDSAENYVIGEVQYLTANKLVVTFTAPFAGKAYLN